MNREELFLAIGGVEESRLARSELCVSSGNVQEDSMNFKPKRVIRNLLIAAVIISTLAVTAYAYTGYVVFENPRAMLEAFFGEQTKPHGPDCGCAECTATDPTAERETLDVEKAMENVAPYISEVGESFVYEPTGLKFTVDAHLFDEAVGCGLVYYTMERTEDMAEYPISYHLQADGEIWDVGDVLSVPSKLYLVQEESTPYKLKIAAYYIRPADKKEEATLKFSFGSGEEERVLYLSYETSEQMKHITLADEKIILSPIGLVIYGGIEGVPCSESNEPQINRVVIRYADGTEYLVENKTEENLTVNYGYSLMDMALCNMTYALNRIVDVDQVEAVVVNSVEYPAK